jgi:hypothetical protein
MGIGPVGAGGAGIGSGFGVGGAGGFAQQATAAGGNEGAGSLRNMFAADTFCGATGGG